MSQAGIVDVEGSHPQIPTLFICNVGTAVPLANTIEILGTAVTAHSVPLQTVGSGNIISIDVQYASAAATSIANNAGVASFDSVFFSVDANGFVTFNGSASTESFTVDAATAPGTNPVVPNGSGNITVTGGQVAAGTTTNVIRTNSLAANTYTIQIQRSQAVGSSTIGDNGVSHFNSTYFTVDANGFVSLNGSGVAETITGNTGGALSPTAGNWNIFGSSVAAGTTPVHTAGSGSTLTVDVQISQAIAATDATKIGLAAFNSTYFTVDANGFVSINGSGLGETITGNSGGPLSPTAGNWNIFGSSVAAGSTPVTTSGAGSTLTVDVQTAQAIVSTDATKIGLAAFNSGEFTVDANGFVSLIGGSLAIDSVMVQASTAPGTNPVLPTSAGLLTINGAAVAAHSIPLQSNSIAANTLQLEIQYSSSAAGSVATNAGIGSFFNQHFTVDSNGFVTLVNGLSASSFGVQAHTAPGTSPVVPTAAGLVTINGTIVAAHSIPIQTDSLAANTLNVEVQRASATASTDTTSQGMSSFNSAQFTVDANGFVGLVGGGSAIEKVNVQTGTTPIVPSSGAITINGATVAAGTNPVRTDGTGANTMAVEVQISQAIAATDATKIGLSAFNSSFFTVDANGFVSINGSAIGETITGNTGGALSPTAGNWNIFGTSTAAGTTPVQTSGTGSTLTVQVQKSQAIASTDATKIGLAAFNSTFFTVDANGFVSFNGAGALETLSDDVGTTVTPSAGNIQLVGHVVEQGATKFSTVVAGTHLVNLNPMSPARWIVDPLGFNGTHTTIGSAITSATSGDTIFILPGTYTENLTLKAGVALTAFGSDSSFNGTGNVIISGKATMTVAGSVTISGIQLQTNSDFFLAVTGSAASIVNLENCYLNCLNNTGISFSTSSSSGQIYIKNCTGNVGTTGIGLYSSSSAGSIVFFSSRFLNSGGSSTASSNSAGAVTYIYANLGSPVSTSSTGTVFFLQSILSTNAVNTTGVTLAGTGSSGASMSYFDSGTASCISIGTGTNMSVANCDVLSSNTNAITGAGTVSYNNVSFSGISKTVNTTTKSVAGTIFGSTNTAPTAGLLGEQIQSYNGSGITPGNATPGNITSINITPGVWDVSGNAGYISSANTMTNAVLGIGTNTASFTGCSTGDNYSQIQSGSGTVVFTVLSASIPSFRVTISTTTTYYLIGQINFTGGSGTIYGRISATRVG